MTALRLIFGIAFALLITLPRAGAEDKIWSAVLLASNVAQPKAPPAELDAVCKRLRNLLGYNQVEIIGSATAKIDDMAEVQLAPTSHFSMDVKARRSSAKEARGGYLLNLQLFHDKQQLVDTEAKIAPESPLFIRGPMHARGQILFVVLVQP